MNSKFSNKKKICLHDICFHTHTHTLRQRGESDSVFSAVFRSIVSHTLSVCPRCLICIYCLLFDAGYSQIGNPNVNDTTEKRYILFIVCCRLSHGALGMCTCVCACAFTSGIRTYTYADTCCVAHM